MITTEYDIAHMFGLNYIEKRYVELYKFEYYIFSFHGKDIFYPYPTVTEDYAKEIVAKFILRKIGEEAGKNLRTIIL